MYRLMYLCRHLEATCCKLNPRWFPAEGEEATIVGAFYRSEAPTISSRHTIAGRLLRTCSRALRWRG